jgi:hypothetical protein
MHQSPQKQFAGQRDRYAELELAEALAERRQQRGSPPKARKFPLREENARDARWERQSPDR